jgi:hypothetical protein
VLQSISGLLIESMVHWFGWEIAHEEHWMVSVEELQRFDLFQSLPPEVLQRLAERLEIIPFQRGVPIFKQGDRGDYFYVVRSGRIGVYRDLEAGQSKLLNELAAGEFFGEEALLSGGTRNATAEGQGNGELLRCDGGTFDGLWRGYPEWAEMVSSTAQLRVQFGAHLPEREPDEVGLVFERRHPYTLIEALIIPSLLVLVVVVILAVLAFGGYLSSTALSGLMILCVIVFGGWVWWLYEDWRNDHFIVTSRRVAHVERTPLTSARRSEALVSQVRGVSTSTPTPGARILGYKTLTIQTGTTLETIKFTGLANAEEVSRKIVEARNTVLARLSMDEKRQELSQQLRPSTSAPRPEPVPHPGASTGNGISVPSETPVSEKLPSVWRGLLNYFAPRMRRVEGNSIIWHRHWYVLFKRTFLPILVTLLLVVLVSSVILSSSPLLGIPLACPIPLVLVFLFAALTWCFWQYEDWHNDYYILTETAIVDRDSLPLGFRERTQLSPLEAVQNVRADVPRWTNKLLNMGDVYIDTIGGTEPVKFDSVFNPFGIQSEVFQRVTAFRGQKAKQGAAELGEWFAAYHKFLAQDNLKTDRPSQSGDVSSQITPL